MIPEVADLRAEAAELDALLRPLPDAGYERVTAFKGYTIADALRHLHQGDHMGLMSVESPQRFREWYAGRTERRARGVSTRDDARLEFGHLTGNALREAWIGTLETLSRRLDALDPAARLVWAGPDMGARMFTTARQMEVWAHGQEIWDVLGRERIPTDRLKNIATIGVRTFGWTFVNRKLPVPPDVPHVRLDAPSGAVWEWNAPSETNRIEGAALDFCQVVTQTRNIADTRLRVAGETAHTWMSIAQCFAGPPETPPAAGSRGRST